MFGGIFSITHLLFFITFLFNIINEAFLKSSIDNAGTLLIIFLVVSFVSTWIRRFFSLAGLATLVISYIVLIQYFPQLKNFFFFNIA